ncbi:hypothetical protein V1499_11120 [Neobacillus sp. SCS-31]|uniref:hypothetical protein n=1 Tax=Neobacillus oceani TaxID=3115292 RepID=UPI00390606F4
MLIKFGIKDLIKVFPNIKNYDKDNENLQIQIYGQRIFRSQTLYEYLLEFLLVFISPKGTGSIEKADQGFSFFVPENGEKLSYFPSPKMGLKRFVFLNRSEQEKRFDIDKEALKEHRDYLIRNMDIENVNMNAEFVLDVLQDLLYGFNAVIGKRSWFAQSLLPVAPELIFCEAMGKKSVRSNLEYEKDKSKVDKGFSFTDRAFMARGGEVYYLHIVQGIKEAPEYESKLVQGLKELVKGIPQLSTIAQYLQETWLEYNYKEKSDSLSVDNVNRIKKDAMWIPDNYSIRAKKSVIELNNLLMSEFDPFEKVELLGKLIAIQIIRMMCLQATMTLNENDGQEWLVDLTDRPNGQIRKMAISSYLSVEENVFRAVHMADIESYKSKEKIESDLKILKEASEDTNKLIRKLSKDIEFLIPPKGKNMRLSLNENLLKVLVLSLIQPGERVLFTTFLEKCYEHFNIIIGPNEALKHFGKVQELDLSAFDENQTLMQELLKNSGFLRDLSDATSIVENPFKG